MRQSGLGRHSACHQTPSLAVTQPHPSSTHPYRVPQGMCVHVLQRESIQLVPGVGAGQVNVLFQLGQLAEVALPLGLPIGSQQRMVPAGTKRRIMLATLQWTAMSSSPHLQGAGGHRRSGTRHAPQDVPGGRGKKVGEMLLLLIFVSFKRAP